MDAMEGLRDEGRYVLWGWIAVEIRALEDMATLLSVMQLRTFHMALEVREEPQVMVNKPCGKRGLKWAIVIARSNIAIHATKFS